MRKDKAGRGVLVAIDQCSPYRSGFKVEMRVNSGIGRNHEHRRRSGLVGREKLFGGQSSDLRTKILFVDLQSE